MLIIRHVRFKFTKFINNSIEILVKILKVGQYQKIKSQDLDVSDLLVERAIGILPNIENNYLGFKIHLKDKPRTRRNAFYHQFNL